MKFWTVVAILALSCLLPVFAMEPTKVPDLTTWKVAPPAPQQWGPTSLGSQVAQPPAPQQWGPTSLGSQVGQPVTSPSLGIHSNDADMTGVKCKKAGGHCVDENDSQLCMVPLKEKSDCPKGEQCCKTGVKNLPLTKGSKKNCKQHSKCKKVGGKCIKNKGKCENKKNGKLCKQRGCTCCLPSPPIVTVTPTPYQASNHLESLIESMNKTLNKKLTEIYEEVQQDCVDEHKQCREWALRGECRINPGYMHFRCRKSCLLCDTCVMLMNDRLSDPLNYYIFAIPTRLLVGVNLCPPDSVSVSYELPYFQSYGPNAEGITCTDNSWVLEQYRQGKTNCHMALQYNTDFWWSDAPDWIEVHQPYYEAMRNCYANSCNGLVCTDDFDTCWLKINTPVEGYGEIRNATNRNIWTTVCQ